MIMMGPKKDKGGMVSIIIEKMKDHYGNGKESNEDYVEGKHDEEKEHEVYEHYREEVDGIFKGLEEKDKELFSESLKMFIKKCVKE
tara:strand:+ start:699 stop:956 length:258 start_codon:yes stop_codon:yes gene_type:complete